MGNVYSLRIQGGKEIHMTEPKNYELLSGITYPDFLKCKFIERQDYWKLTKPLYENFITLHLLVNKEDMYYVINVIDNNTGSPYAPFYNPDLRHNNYVYEEVVKKFNKIMDSLPMFREIKVEEKDKSDMNTEEKVIKIKYHTDIEKLCNIDGKSDWIDLRVAEDTFIPLKEFKLVSLGVSMKLPDGYEAHIVPRSSTFKNFGIIETNSMGVIDNSYCGDDDIWKFPAYCLVAKDTVNGKRGTLLHKNDRICQFRIMKKQPNIVFDEVKKLEDKNRGGFGSTGKK